jgi:hypothetical protein
MMKTRAMLIVWGALLALTPRPALADGAPNKVPQGPWFDACQRRLEAARLAFAKQWAPFGRAKVERRGPDKGGPGVLGLLARKESSLVLKATSGELSVSIRILHGVKPGAAEPGEDRPPWRRKQFHNLRLELTHVVRGGPWDASLGMHWHSDDWPPRSDGFTSAQLQAFERIFKPVVERCLATPP